MEYIVFIHNNSVSESTEEQWNAFFSIANESGLFKGGSEIRNRFQIGKKNVRPITDSVGGYMRFDSESKEALIELLNKIPGVENGGTIEVCEMPRS